MSTITMSDMLEAGVHFGHRTRYWNPKMTPYIFGTRWDIHIINLEKSLPMFKDALNFISQSAANKGKILFVGTKDSASEIIREEAERCGMPYVNHRWLGGMLTNYKTIRLSIRRLKELEEMAERHAFEGLTKKERLSLMREHAKLDRALGGIKNMGGLPDVIFIIDVGNEKIAIDEAVKLSIPVVGIVDTNNSPENIDYLVPGNDDSFRSVRLYSKWIADTIIEARKSIVEPVKKAEKPKAEVKTKEKGKRKVVKKAKAGGAEAEAKPAEAPTAAKQPAKKTVTTKQEEPKAKAEGEQKAAAKPEAKPAVAAAVKKAAEKAKPAKEGAAKKAAEPKAKAAESKAAKGDDKPAAEPKVGEAKEAEESADK